MPKFPTRTPGVTSAPAYTFRTVHTYTVAGDVAVPSGDTDFIPPFFISKSINEYVRLIKCRYKINNGTSVTCELQKNGVAISGFTSLTVGQTVLTTAGSSVLAEDDKIALVVSGVSGTPQNMSFTIVLEHTIG